MLIHGDCLKIMPTLDIKVDMILADLPYGTTACKWDVVIPFEPLWKEYKRIIKNNGVIVLFGSEPFSSIVRMSNATMYKYDWKWLKNYSGGFVMAKKRPMKYHEDIMVFYNTQPTYNPIMRDYAETTKNRFKNNGKINSSKMQGRQFVNEIQKIKRVDDEIKLDRGSYPKAELNFSGVPNCNGIRMHPTQKPVELFEYLIKTYTNEGEIVLDNTAGVMTTAIACINTNRSYICIEKDDQYYKSGEQRVNKHLGLWNNANH